MTKTKRIKRKAIEGLNPLKSGEDLPMKHNKDEISPESELFHAVSDNMLDAIMIIDHEGTILYANMATFRLVGIYDKTDISELNVSRLLPPDIKQTVEDNIFLKDGTDTFSAEYKIATQEGQQRWVETLIKRIVFYGRQADILNIRDITERKIAQQDLRESEERFRALHEAASGGIGIHDKGFIIECNQGLSDITGYSSDELIGMNGLELIEPKWRDYVMQRILGGFQETYDVEGMRKDGTIYPLEIIGKNIPYQGRTVRVTEFKDITVRKHTENALRESEERYRRIISAITDYIYTVYIENGIPVRTVHSPVCEAVTGYTVEEFNANPFLWYTMVAEEDREFVRDHALKVLSGMDAGTIEHRIRHKDGSIRWISNTHVLHREPSGELTSYDGVIKDITQRKLAEEALLESEKKYHSLFSNNHAAMLLINPSSGRITDANPAACTYYGYNRQELISKKMSDINILSADQIFKEMKRAQTGQTRRFEFRHRLASGETRDVEVYSGPITVGGEELLYSIIHDITDRKKAEEALRKSEDRFRSLIQNSSDMVVIIDETGSFIYETPSVQNILGYESGYLIGKTPADFIHSDDFDKAVKALDEVYSDTNTGTPTEFRFRTADGSWIYLEAVGKNLLDYPGITGIVITARDITGRKRAEKDRLEMEKRLLHSQKLESLGVMAGGIAHDFNNLLMAILGNLDLAITDLSPVSRTRRFIDQALLAGRRAAELTNQMLAYSGKGKFDLKSFDISELVEEMARLLKASISKTVSLNLKLEDGLPSIIADPSQIQQIIMNLIVNASEAIGDNAGIVSISTGVRQCNEDYLMQSRLRQKPEPGTYVFLKVSDTGCGMNHETQEKLFDPFFTTKFTGRGLGMAAILGIVRGHKGAIIVDSEQGKGSTITVLLPASGAPARPVKTKQQASQPRKARPKRSRQQSETILVVDDEKMVLDMCSSMVDHFGYKVLTASNGSEALTIFRKHKKDIACVILDLTMPKKDGFAVFEELRRIRKDIPVIISSGFDEQEIGRRFQGKGLSGIIKKPYHIDELGKAIKKVLKG